MKRHAICSQTFHSDIRYKKTAELGNADALFRLPLRSKDLFPPSPDIPAISHVPLPLNCVLKSLEKISE